MPHEKKKVRRRVIDRKQAVAIGMSEAERSGNPNKVGVVMREFKKGTLSSGSGGGKRVQRRRKKH